MAKSGPDPARDGRPAQRRRVRRAAQKPSRNPAVRDRLIEAAAKVVGEHGYAKASIARITEEAGVAHGAFYLHFASRQEIFDILLPVIGDRLLAHIGASVRGARALAEIEAQGLASNLGYLRERPDLIRVLREAEYFAPDAYQAFIGELGRGYVRSLRRSLVAGEIRGFDDSELDVLADILMGARSFLLERHVEGRSRPATEAVARTYLKFVLAGLTGADRVVLDGDGAPPGLDEQAPDPEVPVRARGPGWRA